MLLKINVTLLQPAYAFHVGVFHNGNVGISEVYVGLGICIQ